MKLFEYLIIKYMERDKGVNPGVSPGKIDRIGSLDGETRTSDESSGGDSHLCDHECVRDFFIGDSSSLVLIRPPIAPPL